MNFKSAVPGIYDITVRTTLVYNLVWFVKIKNSIRDPTQQQPITTNICM